MKIYLAVEQSWEYSHAIDEVFGAFQSEKDAQDYCKIWLAKKRHAIGANEKDYPDFTEVIVLDLL